MKWGREELAKLAQRLAEELALPPEITAAVVVTDQEGDWIGVGATCDKEYMDVLIWSAAHGEDRVDHCGCPECSRVN